MSEPSPWESLAARVHAAWKDADGKLAKVRALLEQNGCDCDCDHNYEEHGEDCDLCLACRIGEAVGK